MKIKRQPAIIRIYLDQLFHEAKTRGKSSIELISGRAHKELGMKNRMPQVCRIMYEKMGPRDEILHTTPGGKSSTIKIRYYVHDR